MGTLTSFVLSRAALSLFGTENLSAGQKWLLFPSLLIVYSAALSFVLLGPVTMVALEMGQSARDFRHKHAQLVYTLETKNRALAEIERQMRMAHGPQQTVDQPAYTPSQLNFAITERNLAAEELGHELEWFGVRVTPFVVAYTLIAVVGFNWLVIGLLSGLFPSAVRQAFYPFAERFSRRIGFSFAVIGLLMLLFVIAEGALAI